MFSSAAGQTGRVFVVGGYKTLARGFRRGLLCIAEAFNPVWVVLLLLLCALLFLCARRFPGEGKQPVAGLVVGFLMALAPITLFFVLSRPAVAFRNAVFSFCGLALMVDVLFQLLLARRPWKGAVTGGVCALLAAVFCICAISELHDYRGTWQADQRAARAVCAALEGRDGVDPTSKVGVLGLQPDYLPEQNYRHREHIHGATESVWAFTGLVTATADDPYCPYCTPLPTGWGDLTQYDLLLFYDYEAGTARLYQPETEE